MLESEAHDFEASLASQNAMRRVAVEHDAALLLRNVSHITRPNLRDVIINSEERQRTKTVKSNSDVNVWIIYW